MSATRNERRDLSLCFCGAAGQGLQTAEDLIGRVLSGFGYYVFTTREYMSRVRGGSNSTRVRVSPTPVRAAVDRIDWLFLLAGGLRPNVMEQITAETKIVGDPSVLTRDADRFRERGSSIAELPVLAKAKELGGTIYETTIMAGIAAGLVGIPADEADPLFEQRFKDPETALRNRAAFAFGLTLGAELSGAPLLAKYPHAVKKEILMDGNTSVSLGAAAAGCNFITAYPMSPGTALFRFFAHNAARFGCVVEQVEDEISAINMCIGASYAGARALATTSGGGFALMTEGLSLAGITETPVVVHLAQRPGPATGMATRTEQADLDLALYAGHGEFPRALYAPATIESAFTLAAQAFVTAAKFQTPVVLLTDQYLLDSAYDIPPPQPENIPLPERPVMAEEGYKRYAFPGEGEVVSPRAVPGCGPGLVGLDSHEHTEEAHISEDFAIRTRMMDKRMRKLEAMRKEALPPTLAGDPAFHTLIVCWGSTRETLLEALRVLKAPGVTLASCEQLWPLSEELAPMLARAKRRIFVEGNATAQFARLVHAETGHAPTDTILKYDGQPFSVEEATERLRTLLGLPPGGDIPDLPGLIAGKTNKKGGNPK